MHLQFSAPAYGEARLLRRNVESAVDTGSEGGESTRSGVLGRTRHDLGNLARHILRLDIIGAVGDVIHAPISLVQDVGDGVINTVDRK